MNRKPNEWRDKPEVKLDSTDAFLRCWRAISDGTINKLVPDYAVASAKPEA